VVAVGEVVRQWNGGVVEDGGGGGTRRD